MRANVAATPCHAAGRRAYGERQGHKWPQPRANSTPLKLVKTGKKVAVLTPPEEAKPTVSPEIEQEGKIPPSRIPGGLLRPPGP